MRKNKILACITQRFLWETDDSLFFRDYPLKSNQLPIAKFWCIWGNLRTINGIETLFTGNTFVSSLQQAVLCENCHFNSNGTKERGAIFFSTTNNYVGGFRCNMSTGNRHASGQRSNGSYFRRFRLYVATD